MDFFDWIIVWFIAVVVIAIIAVILGETQKKRAMQNAEKEYDFTTTHQYGDFKVDENTMRFIVSYYTGTSRAYHISEVSGWELVEDGQRYKSEGGVFRAIVGGALFGGTGALVGAATTKRTPTVGSLQVNIYTTDFDTPLVVVHCLHNQPGQFTDTNSIVYRDACNTAYSIMAVLQSMQFRHENITIKNENNLIAEKRRRLHNHIQTLAINPIKDELPNDYVVLDIETTGLEPDVDDIIEIAVVRVIDRKPNKWYARLIKPKAKLSEEVSALNGITTDMLSDKPYIESVIDEIIDFIGDFAIIGHKVEFDIKFLAANSPKVLANKTVDTLELSKLLFDNLERYRLKDIAEHLNVDYTEHQRSLDDCLVIQRCFEILREQNKINK